MLRLQGHNELILCDVDRGPALSTRYLPSSSSPAGIKRHIGPPISPGAHTDPISQRLGKIRSTIAGRPSSENSLDLWRAEADGSLFSAAGRTAADMSVTVEPENFTFCHRTSIPPARAGRHQKTLDAPPGNMQSIAIGIAPRVQAKMQIKFAADARGTVETRNR